MSKLSRTKGHNFERKIANIFKEKGIHVNAKRHLEYQKGTDLGYDLDGTGIFYYQLKNYAKYVATSKIKEVKCDQIPGESIPVLIAQGKGAKFPPVVVMYLFDLSRILIRYDGQINSIDLTFKAYCSNKPKPLNIVNTDTERVHLWEADIHEESLVYMSLKKYIKLLTEIQPMESEYPETFGNFEA